MNIIAATVEDAAAMLVRTADGQTVSLDGYQGERPLTNGQAIEFGVRPEQWSVEEVPEGSSAVSAKIDLVEHMGAENILWAHSGEAVLSAKVIDDTAYHEGESLRLHFLPSQISVFDAASGARI